MWWFPWHGGSRSSDQAWKENPYLLVGNFQNISYCQILFFLCKDEHEHASEINHLLPFEFKETERGLITLGAVFNCFIVPDKSISSMASCTKARFLEQIDYLKILLQIVFQRMIAYILPVWFEEWFC